MGKIIQFRTKEETEYKDEEIKRLEDWICYVAEKWPLITSGRYTKLDMLNFMTAIISIIEIYKSSGTKLNILYERKREHQRVNEAKVVQK